MPGNVGGESRKSQIVEKLSQWWSRAFTKSGDSNAVLRDPTKSSIKSFVETVSCVEEKFKVLQTLGEGEFGQVKLVQCLQTQNKVRESS